MTGDLMWLDATGQASLVREGQVSPSELVEAAIARIEQLNPTLNAVITPLFDKARQQAQSPDLPNGTFHGVPLLLKDYLCQTAGDPFYAGMRYLRDLNWHSPHDTYLAQKFRAAGFIFLGKTNLPELAGGPTTEPAAFGATRNPWNITRSAGGSSGGSAAAVASGMVGVAHGNDGTGSIRIPASCCGLVGLKPSRGRISLGPGNSGGLFGNIAEFVLVRSVRDAAGILDAVAGAMSGDLFAAAPPTRPYMKELGVQPKPLRIGLLIRDLFLEKAVHPECIEAVERTGRFLESLGHHIEYGHPPAFEGPTGLGLALRIISTSGLAASLDAWGEMTGKVITAEDVEAGTWAAAEQGRIYSAVEVHAAYQRLLNGIARSPEWFANGFDLLITPTMTQPPPPLGYDGNLGEVFGLFCMAVSMSGLPAISLPVHWNAEGLPIGVQLVAGEGREDLLLQVASQLEQEFAWSQA